jgi:hypothetical protein
MLDDVNKQVAEAIPNHLETRLAQEWQSLQLSNQHVAEVVTELVRENNRLRMRVMELEKIVNTTEPR